MEKSATGRIEAGFRRFWTRLGTALESILSSRNSVDAHARRIVPVIERVIEENVRNRDGVMLAPDIIEVRFDYETFAGFDDKHRAFLSRELASNINEYVHNRRYTVDRTVQVRLRSDPFTKTVKAAAAFSSDSSGAVESPKAVSMQRPGAKALRTLRFISPAGSMELCTELTHGESAAGLGRSRDNALIVNDSSVSNFHAALSLSAEGEVLIADLGSSNGTSVNGVLIERGRRKPVRSGDRIRFGDVDFVIEFEG